MNELPEEDIKRLWFAELLNKKGADTGVNVEEVFEKLTGETMNECECECAIISTKRMYIMLLTAQEKLLQNTINKKEIISLLSSIEHDILLLNDKDNSIERDLFQ